MRRFLAAAAVAAGLLASGPATAQSNAYIGQIMPIGTNGWCPVGWLLAEGQLLPIAQNAALFEVLGTTYGGDGKTTFGLPNLKGVKLGTQPVTWCIANTGFVATQR
jgi:microcystin-dependent protein